MRASVLTCLLLASAAVCAQPLSTDAFVRAAARGDLATVSAALDAGMSPDASAPLDGTTGDAITALAAASWNNRADVVARLIAAGADVHLPDAEWRTPLAWAATGNAAAVVPLLLDAGADLYAGSLTATTAADQAVQAGAVDVLRLFLNEGVDPNEEDEKGPLLRRAVRTWAAQANIGVVDLLLATGADAGYRAPDGSTLLHAAVDDTPGALLLTHRLLMAGADPAHLDADGHTPAALATARGADLLAAYYAGEMRARAQADLLGAVLRGDASAVARAIAAGADPNAGTRGNGFYGADAAETGTTDGGPLHLAVFVGAPQEVLAALVAGGADPNAVNDYGFPPLTKAAERSALGTVEALLALGASAEGGADRPFLAMDPIHWAATAGAADVVALLIQRGADPALTTNPTMGYGYNALGFAVHHGHTATVQVLLEAGEDVQNAGETSSVPLDVAVERGWDDIAELLRARGAQSSAEVARADAQARLDAHGADGAWTEDRWAMDAGVIGALLEMGHTPPPSFLHTVLFTVREDLALVERLLAAGADVNVAPEGTGGMTMLHEAAANGFADLVEILLDAGADPTLRNDDGLTAREMAEQNEIDEVVAMFEGRGL